MDCHVIHVEQGSDDWDALRRCRITGSRLGDVMADRDTKRYKKYRSEMVLEMNGVEFHSKDEPWFAHGKEMEPRALAAWQWKYGPVLHDVFLIHHRYDWLGLSPDLIAKDMNEGGEIKCRKMYRTYKDIVTKIERSSSRKPWIPPENIYQVQAAMWVTGLRSWWFVNYYENPEADIRRLHRVLVPRDDKLIAEMERRCLMFMAEVRKLSPEDIG